MIKAVAKVMVKNVAEKLWAAQGLGLSWGLAGYLLLAGQIGLFAGDQSDKQSAEGAALAATEAVSIGDAAADKDKAEDDETDEAEDEAKSKKTNEVSEEAKKEVRDLVAQFAAVINTKNGRTIGNFIDFYVDSGARFDKHVMLFDPHIPGKVIAEEKISLNKQDFVKYITTLITSPVEYAMLTNVTSITPYNRHMPIAVVDVKEVAISNIADDGEASKKKSKEFSEELKKIADKKKQIKTIVSGNCTMVMRQSATMVINGMSCIEKIIIY